MTRAEVEAILGGPPGDYSGDPIRGDPIRTRVMAPLLGQESWLGPECDVTVYFGAGVPTWKEGTVIGKEIDLRDDSATASLRRLRRWLWP
jgi:hypothetical protein